MGRAGRAFALVLLGLAVALGLEEIGFRRAFSPNEIGYYVSDPQPAQASRWVDHPFLPFVGRPGIEYEIDVPPGAHIKVSNNAYGFRSHELPASKSASDYFIVALGESTTWGAAAESNATTWPELLEARLRARYPERNVRAFNFGTQNVTLPYSVVVLALIATHIQPDLVIVYHGFNELGPATAVGYRFDYAHFYRDLALDRRWLGFQRSVPRSWLSSYTVAYLTAAADKRIGINDLSYYVQRPIEFDESLRDDDALKRALARDWGHLLTIDAMARTDGGQALFSTFQFYDGNDHTWQVLNQSLRAYFAEHGIDYVDQDALIPDYDRSVQFDPCHFTRAGDEMMAENFFRKIVEERLLEKR